jgi:hypothetical protein
VERAEALRPSFVARALQSALGAFRGWWRPTVVPGPDQ